MRAARAIDEHSVFLNVPFDKGYERTFVALIAAIVCLSRTPRSVLEIPEDGQGRLKRLQSLISECRVSVHELSRVGTPVRFNMPFELGLACATSTFLKGKHSYILMERVQHRLDRTLSDIKGRDAIIHGGKPRQALYGLLSALAVKEFDVDPDTVCSIDRTLAAKVAAYKRKRRHSTVFSPMMFQFACQAASRLAQAAGLVEA